MPSIQAKFMNLLFCCIPGDKPGQPHDYAAERERNAARKAPKLPQNVKLREEDWGEILTKEGNRKGWIFYIHGGGFTTGSAKERRALTQEIADHYGYNVISINYRLAPENKWPAQIEDCLANWERLPGLGIAGSDTVLMGESAGGTLVLSLALLLKQKGFPMPKAVVSFSPCVNQADHYPSHTANIKTDTMLKDAVYRGLAEPVFRAGAMRAELCDPIASPIFGDYAGLPPVFLSASDAETLYDDSRELYKKLSAEGHRVELDIQHGVCHAFQMFPTMPEARETLNKVFAFLE